MKLLPTEVRFNNKRYSAKTADELIIKLRLQTRASYRQIGNMLGVSGETIRKRLLKYQYLDYFEQLIGQPIKTYSAKTVNKLLAEGFSNNEVAAKLDINLAEVIQLRKDYEKAENLRGKTINVSQRRRNVVKRFFGEEYLPGPRFLSWLEEQISEVQMGGVAEQRIRDFYVKGAIVDQDSRNYRTLMLKRFEKHIEDKNINPEHLVLKGVLIANNSKD